MLTILAAISGEQVINAVIWIVVVGLCFWLLTWLIAYCGLPEPFSKIAKVVLAVASVIILINVLLSFTGNNFIRW